MKVLIPILIGLLVVGCGKGNQTAKESSKAIPSNNSTGKPTKDKANKETPSKVADNNATKLVKELSLRENVVGTYEAKGDRYTNRAVFLGNGIVEFYENGNKSGLSGGSSGATWKISKQGELHIEESLRLSTAERPTGPPEQHRTNPKELYPDPPVTTIHTRVHVLRINHDGSITFIANIDNDGKRGDFSKERQYTLKKIKSEKETPSKEDDKNSTEAKPAKELMLREKVVGEYEFKEDGDTFITVLLENGIVEDYKNGKKEEDWKWEISKEGELYFIYEDVEIGVYRINKDGSITVIADISDGKRTDIPKEYQFTLKKIK